MPNQTNTHAPVTRNERIQYLDILRGIAILFIFIANITYFSGTAFYSEATKLSFATSTLDHMMEIFSYTFIDGKFYSIFSILFGIGFVVQYNSAMKSGKSFVPFFRRRMLGLLLIGLAHLFLVWVGDILTLYALLGLTLIWFRDFEDKRLLKWAAVLLLLPIVHWLGMFATGLYYPYPLFFAYDHIAVSQGFALTDWMGAGYESFDPLNYLAMTEFGSYMIMTVYHPLVRFGMLLLDGRFFKVLALFLIGIWAGRQILDKNILENRDLLKKITLWGFAVGLPVSIFRSVINYSSLSGDFWTFMSYITYACGVVPLACGYAAAIALFVLSRKRLFIWFAPVGRTALSNYIFQSFIAIIIFYGIGFGYAGKFSYSIVLAITIAIFLWQIAFSIVWLKYFRFGPIEWVWRQMTYGKRIPLLIDKSLPKLPVAPAPEPVTVVPAQPKNTRIS